MTDSMTYTVEEAARLLGVSRGVAYEAARRGELPTIRLCRRLLVPRIALERMLGMENADGPAGNGTARNDPAAVNGHGAD
jgi:excisionase family DNA binding protein